VCILCNGFVQWLIRRDDSAEFRFVSLQSATGQAYIADMGHKEDTVYLVQQGITYQLSDVALESCKLLGGGWKLLYVLRWIPTSIRNLVYRWIAKNRYRWFGQSETCILPDSSIKARFLDI
jgi:predicted DCC family thiol-disulfide oxidoreductase YuxK